MELCQMAKPGRFITVGEVMLRLTPPKSNPLQIANSFEAVYG